MFDRRLRMIAVMVGLMVAGEGRATAQQTPDQLPPVFRVRSDYVLIDFIAEKDEAFVGDLRLEEIEVYEDGKKQTIKYFELIDLNGPRDTGREPGRPPVPDAARLALLVDLSRLDLESRHFIKLHTRDFIQNNLVPGDLMMVAGMGRSGMRIYTPFTSNIDDVLAGLERALLSPDGWVFGEKPDLGFNVLPSDLPVPTISLDGFRNASATAVARAQRQYGLEIRKHQAVNSRSALLLLARYLQPLPGRKNVVLFSEGYRLNLGEFENLYDDFRSPIRAANRAQISFYAVDPRGLAVNRSQFQGQEFHNLIARETGGLGPLWTNDLGKRLRNAYEESRRYYRIAYARDEPSDPGRVHRIRVKVTRKGVAVRARDEYVEPNPEEAGKYDPALALAFPSLFHEFDFRLKTTEEGGRLELHSRIPTDQVLFREEGSQKVAEVAFFALVTNLRGEPVTKKKLPLSRTYTLRFSEAQLASLEVLTADHPLDLQLKSGQYRLTFAIHQPWAERVSATSTTITVP